ncbi:MAG: hypothetical protein M1819_003350 [Sarea resinae]|nr:MAG: hypothetical protein M1819_003350 [Sarea resinae]
MLPQESRKDSFKVLNSPEDGSVVKLYIGPFKKHYRVQKKLLRHHSFFFLNKLRADPSDEEYYNAGIDPEVFDLFVCWLSQKPFEDSSRPARELPSLYLRLYLLCLKLQVPELQRLALRNIQRLFKVDRECFTCEWVALVYETHTARSLRALAARIAAYQYLTDETARARGNKALNRQARSRSSLQHTPSAFFFKKREHVLDLMKAIVSILCEVNVPDQLCDPFDPKWIKAAGRTPWGVFTDTIVQVQPGTSTFGLPTSEPNSTEHVSQSSFDVSASTSETSLSAGSSGRSSPSMRSKRTRGRPRSKSVKASGSPQPGSELPHPSSTPHEIRVCLPPTSSLDSGPIATHAIPVPVAPTYNINPNPVSDIEIVVRLPPPSSNASGGSGPPAKAPVMMIPENLSTTELLVHKMQGLWEPSRDLSTVESGFELLPEAKSEICADPDAKEQARMLEEEFDLMTFDSDEDE